jgi:hypothetical protein
MELLSTVHFLATQQNVPADATEVARQVSLWSARKRRLFPAEDVTSAWQRLYDTNLIAHAR